MSIKCPYCDFGNAFIDTECPELTIVRRDYVMLYFGCTCMNCERDFYLERKYWETDQIDVLKTLDPRVEPEVDE